MVVSAVQKAKEAGCANGSGCVCRMSAGPKFASKSGLRQMWFFDEQNLSEINSPNLTAERLVARYSPTGLQKRTFELRKPSSANGKA